MEFRWLAAIALWTVLSGPVFGPPAGGSARSRERTNKAGEKLSSAKKLPAKK
jgi:hypothetical protein